MRKMILVLLLVFLPATAYVASFDCTKASSKVEKFICADAKLSKLDEELNAAYKAALQNEKEADSIKQVQKQWVKERNSCKQVDCLKVAYQARIHELRGAGETVVNKSRAYYVLMMSEDDSVCKPILAEYNRNISLDLWPQPAPHPYPWPAPPALTLPWKIKPWKNLAENERVLEKSYTLTEADMDGDGKNETVVRWASWMRSDYRFSSLEFFSRDTVLPDQMKAYQQFRFQNAIAEVIPDGYDFPKLKGRASPRSINDFDVIQFNGRQYVTGKTVDMDGIVEVRDAPQWRIVSRVRYGKPTMPPQSDLDWVLDSVCYFKLNITK